MFIEVPLTLITQAPSTECSIKTKRKEKKLNIKDNRGRMELPNEQPCKQPLPLP